MPVEEIDQRSHEKCGDDGADAHDFRNFPEAETGDPAKDGTKQDTGKIADDPAGEEWYFILSL